MDGDPHQRRSDATWKVGLFHCSPSSSVSDSILRPWTIYGRVQNYLNPNYQSTTGRQCYEVVCCTCVYLTRQRKAVREKHGIDGTEFVDSCTSVWCFCCALVQLENEIGGQQAVALGDVNKTGYQGETEGMRMPQARV